MISSQLVMFQFLIQEKRITCNPLLHYGYLLQLGAPHLGLAKSIYCIIILLLLNTNAAI